MRSALERPGKFRVQVAAWPTLSKSPIQGLTFGSELSSPSKRAGALVACVKTSDTAVISKSDEKNSPRGATFPSGFEALVLEVCDETEIAELKLKVGDFEMHLKRNIGAAEAPVPAASSTAPPPTVSEPVTESAPASPTKSASEKSSPFVHVPVEKARKIAALEASGTSGYVLVASPTVGAFRKNRTVKGKTLPPLLKQGDIVKEGQVICYLDQFSKELPVKSDAAGEVIKILFNEGEAVGYGDPLIAVHPSFHNIK